MRASAYPTVNFRLDRYEADIGGAAATVRIVGRLDIAGVERPLAVTARLIADTSGTMHVQGEYAVRMSDFGVRPPRRFGGLLTVRDRVAVHFDVVPADEDDAGIIAGRASRPTPPSSMPGTADAPNH